MRSNYLKCDGLSGKGLDKDLHTTTQTEDEMEGGFFLDVVVAQGAAILKLLTSEDQTLLIRRDTFNQNEVRRYKTDNTL